MLRSGDVGRVRGRSVVSAAALEADEGGRIAEGDVIEVAPRRRGNDALKYRVTEIEEAEGRVWLTRLRAVDVPRLLTPAARPGGTEKGYTDKPWKAMFGEPEAVGDDWQTWICQSADRAGDERRAEEQRDRERQPFIERVRGARARARACKAGRETRGEIRTIEILGSGDRRRAVAMLSKLEKRLFY